ncbi:hypothetical protein ACFS7Z_19725 [Pontibacter toksunensis]|uniref:Polysaccharide deacetylase n=1 Tax=Pontibacter toksunensis TaxID=1332631 RepID=A0ABW6BXQ8_9BACT
MNFEFYRSFRFILLALFISLSVNAFGQQLEQRRDDIYKFPEQILEDLENDTVKYYTKAAHEFSFIGDYKKALLYADIGRPQFATLTPEQIKYFKSFKPVGANQFLKEKAQEEQIIIINEGHHLPLHRVFTHSLLQDLYEAGFRYFGAETLSHTDKELNQRGYPVFSSGFYTKEPQYGELVRAALSIGFKVFAYEGESGGREREIEQAENIARVLQKDPEAKILVHVGYDHIREDSALHVWEKAMAGRLDEITGINPFTVNQEILTEKSRPELENPYLKLASVTEPTIYVNADGDGFAGPPGFGAYDVRVFHPKTSYIHGRPDWMFTLGRKPVFINKRIKVNYPVLVFAYKAGEDISQAIPVDVIELKSKQDKKALALKKGKYSILVLDKNGGQQTVSIKD